MKYVKTVLLAILVGIVLWVIFDNWAGVSIKLLGLERKAPLPVLLLITLGVGFGGGAFWSRWRRREKEKRAQVEASQAAEAPPSE